MRRLLPCALIVTLFAAFVFVGDQRTPILAQADPVVETPTVAPREIIVKLDGPTSTATGFAIAVTAPPDAVLRWENSFPPGASKPTELFDAHGRRVLAFFDTTGGVYRFKLSAQIPVDGLDPFDTATHTVTVSRRPEEPGPGPGPVEPPTTPSEPNASLNQLTAVLRPFPVSAATLRDFYATMAADLRGPATSALKTLGDLRAWQVELERSAFAGTDVAKIKGVAAALGGFLDDELGLDDPPLDREKASAVFVRVSAACGRAVR